MRKRITPLLTVCFLIAFVTLPVIPFAYAQDEGFTSDDQSGNDPREFTSKFMP